MAYSELVKNFNRIRDYMRQFYVYGFKSRDEYTGKSARSYDDERRRIESWLGDHMQFRSTADGKRVFLSIDSRQCARNPLYKAWKAKSFTDGDVTLHFLLFDILYSPEVSLPLSEIMDGIDGRLAAFSDPRAFDESTVRKKLKEYEKEGVVVAEKRGKTAYYRRAADGAFDNADVLDFFSEVAPCGVVGSYLLDKTAPHDGVFSFKHHYITGAMDSEIVCALLDAISGKRCVYIEKTGRGGNKNVETAVPLRLLVSAQSGRSYVMAYITRIRRIVSYRTDYILSVREGDVCADFDRLREKLDGVLSHVWGVSTQNSSGARMEHVEFTVTYGDDERHIPGRLEREKRCGTVEHIDGHTSRFSADVFDAHELTPWIRTFICRITDISFSDKELEAQFKNDIEEMYAMYGLEGGDGE